MFKRPEQTMNKPINKLLEGEPYWLMSLLEPYYDEQGNLVELRVIKSFKRENKSSKTKRAAEQDKPKTSKVAFDKELEL